MQAALLVFSTHGYRASRLEDVAKAANVTKGTIYHYFRDKEELLTFAIAASLKPALDSAEKNILKNQGSMKEVLESTLTEAWKRWTDPAFTRLYRLVTGEIASSYPLIFRQWFEAGPARTWKLWQSIIEAGVKTGEFRKDVDAKSVSRLMLSSFANQAVFESLIPKSSPDYYPPKALLESTRKFMLDALEANPKGRR